MAGDNVTYPWDQLPGEPPEAYARFLVYRNMGPARTIDNAYIVGSAGKRKKSQATSGQWTADSAAYNWRERAARWDIAQLSAVVPETAGVIFEAIREFSRQVLAEVQAGVVINAGGDVTTSGDVAGGNHEQTTHGPA